jgi:hypothetical protein
LLPFLSIRQSHFQLYGLKLLKSLLPFKDQEWRSRNKELVSRVYFTVRFDLIDHWLSTSVDEADVLSKAMDSFRVSVLVVAILSDVCVCVRV